MEQGGCAEMLPDATEDVALGFTGLVFAVGIGSSFPMCHPHSAHGDIDAFLETLVDARQRLRLVVLRS